MKNGIYIILLVVISVAQAGTFDLLYDDFDNGVIDSKWVLTGIDFGEVIDADGNSLNFGHIDNTAGIKSQFGGFNSFLRFTSDVFIPDGTLNGQEAVVTFSDSAGNVPVDIRIVNESGVTKLKVRKKFNSGTIVYDSVSNLSVNTWYLVIFEVNISGTQANQISGCCFSVALNGTYLRTNTISYPIAYPIITDIYNGYNVEGVMDTVSINSSITGIRFDNIQVSNNYRKFRIAGDINFDGQVDMKDFADMASSWLNEKAPLWY